MATWDELIRSQQSQKIVAAYPTLARPDGLGGVEYAQLNLSTHAVRPDRCAVYHDPRLRGVPRLAQAIREPFTGRSQITYGSLEVLVGDGRLDAHLADWCWLGQPISLSLGFPELDVADWRVVFTGRMGAPRQNDRVLTVPIQDGGAILLETKITPGDLSGDLDDMVQDVLDAAGITGIDATAWAAWAAANPWTAWLRVGEGDTAASILDKLLAPIGCWYTFDRLGNFVVATFAAPDAGAADLELVDDVRALSYEGQVQDKQFWRIALKYLTATGDSPTYGTVSQDDASILTLNPLAKDIERETCLTGVGDAQAVLARQWALWSVRRRVHKVAAKAEPFAVDLGGQVYLSRRHARFGLTGGNCRVVALETVMLGKSRVTLELMQ
jgi:hypothetical protein